MRYRMRLLWCWIKYLGSNVSHYYALLRWWWRGKDHIKPFDTRSMSYNSQRLLIVCKRWLKRQGKTT